MDVTSFGIDHNQLLRGIYISRVDRLGAESVTSFDIRMKEPNREPIMDTAPMHTLEHLLAIFFRGDADWADRTIYIGPMGCRTGFYFLFKGDLTPQDIAGITTKAFESVVAFEDEVPATKAAMCGNYLDHNLGMAQWESKKYLEEVLYHLKPENMVYPQIGDQ